MLVGAWIGQGSVATALAQQHAAPVSVGKVAFNADKLDAARKLVQEGKPDAAMLLLETADLHGDEVGDIHALKGVCLALMARPVESAAEFDAAIALRPNYAPTYFSAGLAFAGFNNLDGALNRLESALRLDPDLPGARYNYALVLARAGRYADSEKQVQIELGRLPRKGESELDLRRLKARDLYAEKNWPEALQAYRKALELQPGWPEAYGAMGEALFSLNRSQESLPMLKKSEAVDPDNATTHLLLGKVYQEAGKLGEAIAELEWAQRLRPNDQEALYRLERLYSLAGDTANAGRTQALLKELVATRYNESLSETRASPLNDAGLELEKKGDLSGALQKFDQAAAEDATNPIFKRNAALVLCKLGKTEEAIGRLRDILALDPDDAQALQILSVAKEFEGRRAGRMLNLPSLEAVR